MDEIYQDFIKIGFKYITLDLKGYRSGALNEILWMNELKKKT
jgi:PP-loop superfamily ATP-utilizing enzyme